MSKNRYEIKIRGIVQGIGFRPFIYRIAQELNIKGWVKNTAEGVIINAECEEEIFNQFCEKINQEKPILAEIHSLEIKQLNYIGDKIFKIENSENNNLNINTIIPTDLATCRECLTELFNYNNRRYLYPFINCTNCGSRYSIIDNLPYDRIGTTMKNFTMCLECKKEYNHPLNRRFHAQPNACKKCGPHIELWDKNGNYLTKFEQVIKETVNLIKQGKIIAVKGLGGFHLVVDASNNSAVKKLRLAKNRPYKPFALMYPNLEQIKRDCFVSQLEEKTLLSSPSPIVLLRKKKVNSLNLICEEIAPNNPYLGVMLPYTPLHHLLINELNSPIVATSGNRQSEPICIDEKGAIQTLNNIADYFLVHNRPILIPIDDSIVRIIDDEIMVLRLARGYAPLAINLTDNKLENSLKILALGGHLKSTVAMKINQQIFLSQHLGDLDNHENMQNYRQTINHFKTIYNFQPDIIACDFHPDYYSSQYAQELSTENNKSIPIVAVQHHIAHIFSTFMEKEIKFPLLGIAWDGTGYGLDHTIWGGEFFYITDDKIQRIASFLPFHLLGGNQAIINPKRIALSLLIQVFNDLENIFKKFDFISSFSAQELKILTKMYEQKINSPLTSSVGRLFDGISALLGIVEKVTYEGEGAMKLEFVIDDLSIIETYPFDWQYNENCCSYIDWKPIIKNIIEDYLHGESVSLISAKFHQTLVKIIDTVAKSVLIKNVVLAGGCWQNKYLLENTLQKLKGANLRIYYPQKFPTNDGGLALGQIIFASRYKNIKTIKYD